MKKGQGISMNVIIIAALALIVFVVLIAVFGGRLGVFQEKVVSTEEEAGSKTCGIGGCLAATQDCPAGRVKTASPTFIDCSGNDVICCAKPTSCTGDADDITGGNLKCTASDGCKGDKDTDMGTLGCTTGETCCFTES